MTDELPNIGDALNWGLTHGAIGGELAVRLAECMWIYWQTRGYLNEGRRRVEEVLSIPEAPSFWRAILCTSAGFLAWIQGDDEQARRWLDEAEVLAEETHQIVVRARVHFFRALLEWRNGVDGLPAMERELVVALANFDAADDSIGQIVCLLAAGVGLTMAKLYPFAIGVLERAREWSQEFGYEWGAATGGMYLGEALKDAGDLDGAVTSLRQAIVEYDAIDDDWGIAVCLASLGDICATRGNLVEAARHFGLSQRMLGKIGALLPPTESDRYLLVASNVREELGPVEFDRAFAEGTLLDPTDLTRSVFDAGCDGTDDGADTSPQAGAFGLTNREREILNLVVRGMTDLQIARELFISTKTVSWHVGNLLDKTGTGNRTELAAAATRAGVV